MMLNTPPSSSIALAIVARVPGVRVGRFTSATMGTRSLGGGIRTGS